MALDPNTTYAALYRAGLTHRDYNILLTDFSYFQFQHTPDGASFSVRYAFYPNPHERAAAAQYEQAQLLGDEGDGYELFLDELTNTPEDHRVPAIRYEVAFTDYKPLVHPTAHFHFGLHSENRWPAQRVFTPLAFALVIAKQFFCDAWHEHGQKIDPSSKTNAFDAKLFQERIQCPILPEEYFSGDERRQFFFS